MTRKDVLIVEDDDAIRLLVHAVLTRIGLTCDTARDGVFALEILSSTRYAVVLLDLMMPRLDGFGVLEKMTGLRFSEAERPIVFVMTAATERGALETVGGAAHAIVKKPFDVHGLGELVHDCVIAHAMDPSL